MVLFSAIALVLSAVLCIHALSGRGLIGCSAGTSCNEVLGSRWSFLFGRIPVSGLAAICYIAMTVCLLFRRSFDGDPQFARWMDRGMLVLSGAIIGAAIWFIWLQKNMIRSFCPYCMTAHICGLLLSALLLVRIIGSGPGSPEDRCASAAAGSPACCRRILRQLSFVFAGLVLAGCLAGLQLLTTPRTAFDRGFIPEALPLPDPQEMPSVGDPASGTAITLLFDYRCSHCQKIHSLLPEVVSLLGGQVAIVPAPVPLSKDCNPYIPAGEDRFKGSCELTRYALALLRLDRASSSFAIDSGASPPSSSSAINSGDSSSSSSAIDSGASSPSSFSAIDSGASSSSNSVFAEFDAWLFESDAADGWYPREPEEAFEKACSLVGEQRLLEALQDPWITGYLTKIYELFGRTSTAEKAAVPRFICGDTWLVPDVDDAPGLAALLQTHFLDTDL